MRLTILKNFISVILIAMAATGLLFFITISAVTRKETKSNMRMTLMVLDQTLNYDQSLKSQIAVLPTTFESKEARYTILAKSGEVIADSRVSNYETLENHSQREEFIGALQHGYGAAYRYSSTLDQKMLYTAIQSRNSDYILRIAIPYTGNLEALFRLLPAVILSITVGAVIAYVFARRLSYSIIQPVNQLTNTIKGYDEEVGDLVFDATPYEELNIIAEAATQMAESVKQRNERIEFERMVRQEFFANASHELKTPITSIRGFMELMLGGFTKDEETREQFMHRVLKETEHMTDMINEILLISQLETNEMKVEDQEIRMTLLLEDVRSTLEPIALTQQVTLTSECRPIVMLANYEYMRELLLNLISNGIKYNKPGGTVEVMITSNQDDVMIVVKDTGVGIEPQAKERIFERFYRIDKGRSKKVGGTGLGLSIVKHVVSYYNGTIEVTSTPNIGSEFRVCFLHRRLLV